MDFGKVDDPTVYTAMKLKMMDDAISIHNVASWDV